MSINYRTPILICDICGKEEEVTRHKNRYGMHEAKLSEFYTNGDGNQFEMINKKEKVFCSVCFGKMLEESKTFRRMYK